MKVPNLRTASVFLALVALALPAGTPAASEARAPAVDQSAVDTLKRMTDFIGGLKEFSVRTVNTYEDQLDSGQRIDLDVAADVTVRRPNKVHANRSGARISQDFYYDGKTLTLYNPSDDVYASESVPGTIAEMLDYAREDLGLIVPASDLVYPNAFDILMQGVTSAVVVGKVSIGGVTCDHLAFHRPDVDFQVWVASGDRPLPCKYVVTDTSTPENVSTVTVMSDWDLAPKAPDTEFRFVPPEGAQAISFMPLEKTKGSGR
ncbi:MAG: DUF2092 domain-containing protein [Pseudomonadota bacterium]|nr:DUF2092 domain-containing protein [Pseudomonadota bacterium]